MSRVPLLAIVACCVVAVANAGVTIDKSREGDGVNFPTVGKSIKVRAAEGRRPPRRPRRA